MPPKPAWNFIDELERLLNSEEDIPIQILPNGEIRQIGHTTSAEKLRKRQIGMLETIKRKAGPLVGMMPSANMRDRACKIYDLAKELQDDLTK